MSLTKEEFNQIFQLNPTGNAEHTFKAIEYYIENSDTDFDGNTIDFKYIYDRYKEYLNWWKDSWGKRDQKYVAKENRLKELYRFLNDEDHKKSFVTTPTNRIFYLTNNKSISELKMSLFKFIKETTRHG